MGLSSEAAPSFKNQQMLQLLWSVLNIAVFLGFVFVCYKTTVFIRKKVNLFVSILFVLVLLSFVDAADKSPEISYHFTGILYWKLLGIPFYAQEKYFSGLLNP